ncbi:uncharacterized protein I206_106129 [Kwoniella pini CBS 10737]|uniref:Uncharacterized protein n=1 Tax=Kwoniella pini CBS 10737 TaxID=1296096 RepID=A0AAJ8MSE3_9TREE
MPSDPKRRRHRSTDPKKRSRESREDESAERKHRSSPKDDAQRKVKDTAKTVGSGAGKAYDTIADLFGGEKELNRTIRRYNPTFYEFADKTCLKNFGLPNKPSKFLLFIIALALLQSFIPLFQWPLDFVARWLGFVFLFGSGTEELKLGFESSRKANKIKSLLTIFLILSALQLIPNFLFDTYYHFGALWSFFLPVILFITPFKETPDQTIASIICDTFFSSFSMVLGSLIPDSMQGENTQNMAILVGGVVALLFAIEGISIPGIISVIGLIQYYLPSYFLWMTGFMFAMLMTKKIEKRHRADTWYAKWLMGVSKVATPKSSLGSDHRSPGKPRESGRPDKHRSPRSDKDRKKPR